MIIKPKFEIGQSVYTVDVRSTFKNKAGECDICGSTGYIKSMLTNTVYPCPACRDVLTFECQIVDRNVKIIEISTSTRIKDNQEKTNISYHLKDAQMCWIEEDLVFISESEAQAYCDEQNV